MKNIQQDIKQNQFKNVYLLYGEEQYLKRYCKNSLRKALVGEDSMNFSHYEGKNINIQEIIDQAETVPFFAEHRLLMIEESGFFKNAPDDALVDYMKHLPEYVVLVFVESEVDRRNRLYKAVNSVGYVSECVLPDTASLAGWVKRGAASYHKEMDARTIQRFIEYTGWSMDNMNMELSKVVDYVGNRESITLEDVESICTVTMENKLFDMIRNVALKRQKQALEQYYDLLLLKEPPMKILALLSKQFQQILVAKDQIPRGVNGAALGKILGIPPFAVSKVAEMTKYFTVEELRDALETCAGYETDVKMGRMQDRLSVELIIIRYSSKKL